MKATLCAVVASWLVLLPIWILPMPCHAMSHSYFQCSTSLDYDVGLLIPASSVRSRLECAVLCRNTPDCTSFHTSKDNGTPSQRWTCELLTANNLLLPFYPLSRVIEPDASYCRGEFFL